MGNRDLKILSGGKPITLCLTETSFWVKTSGKKRGFEVALRQVISAATQAVQESQFLEVYCLVKKKKEPFFLKKIDGRVNDEDKDAAGEWVSALMQASYQGIKPRRRLRVLVNPHGGPGKAPAVLTKVVEPIFRAANCSLAVTFTTHRGHAYEIAKDLPLDYDVVVTLSGDGLVHEVINGFAHHPVSATAFGIPVVPIPTGSGNGLSLNLLGMEDGFDVAAAALNVIKGIPMKTDLFSITQNGKRTLSFMSQALGLMADLDIGTENLRWMGDTRFVLGFLRGVIHLRSCPIRLSIKVAEQDKHVMAEAARARREKGEKEIPLPSTSEEPTNTTLPSLKYSGDEEDGWITFDKPVLYLYAGQGPYVARDFMAFPVSLPDDGLIDITVQEVSSRWELLATIGGAPKGEPYWLDSQHYFKAHAYRVKPLSTKGCLAIDGEEFPFEEYQVEVHRGLGTFLSPYGYYAANFQARPDHKNIEVGGNVI